MADSTSIIAYCGFATSILGVVYAAINHKRVRSKCCGRSLEASIDIENTTPTSAVAFAEKTLTTPSVAV